MPYKNRADRKNWDYVKRLSLKRDSEKLEKERKRQRDGVRIRRARKPKIRKLRKRKDPIQQLLASRIEGRIRQALRGKNVLRRLKRQELVGCSWAELKLYIENKMHPFMTWENYGRAWHIDHIVPCGSYDLELVEEQRRCFHYLNLRPLWAKTNLRRAKKGAFQPTLGL